MPQSHIPAGAQALTAYVQHPHNLPANELLHLLRARHELRFAAREMPPCFNLKLRGQRTGLPLRGWAILVRTGEGTAGPTFQVMAMGLGEEDAKRRAELLNRRGPVPTGFHTWS